LRQHAKERARDWELQPNKEFINRLKQRSMLHHETLCLLDFFARRSRRGVLEIGAYMGGGTAVLAQAIKESGRRIPLATIEVGGAHPNRFLPSTDILTDLRTTLADNQLSEHVTVLEGWSNEPSNVSKVREIFGKRRIDLLIIDADGDVDRDFALYRDLLAFNAIIVCDDYSSPLGNPKVATVSSWVDQAVSSGMVREIGVFPWGTWFGEYRVRPKRWISIRRQ
jgi:predicted O-methyltransferase YrrM